MTTYDGRIGNRRAWLELQLEAAQARLQQSPEEARALRDVGSLLGRLGRNREALDLLQRAVTVDPEDAEAWYFLGVASASAGEPGRAGEAAERFERLAPRDALGLARRANLRHQLGENAAAVELAQEALPLASEPQLLAWIHGLLALTHEALGDGASHLRHLEAAVKADPESVVAVSELASARITRGEYAAARPLFQKWAALDPEDADAWAGLGIAAHRTGDTWGGRDALEKAIALGRVAAGSFGELGAVYSTLGEHRRAVAVLERALELAVEASQRSWICASLGDVWNSLDDPSRALACYQAAVEADPTDARAHRGLAAGHADFKDYAAALPHLETATRLRPEDPDAWYVLGRVLAWTGELERAQEALEKSIALGHASGEPHAQLAWVYQRQGRAVEAAEQAKRALRRPLPKKWRAWVAGIVRNTRPSRR